MKQIRPHSSSMTGEWWWVVQSKASGSSAFDSPRSVSYPFTTARDQAYIHMISEPVGPTPKYRIFNRWTGVHHEITARPRTQGLDLRVGPGVVSNPDMPDYQCRFVICVKEPGGWAPVPTTWGGILETNAFTQACDALYNMDQRRLQPEEYAVLDTKLCRALTFTALQTAESMLGERCRNLTMANAFFGLRWLPNVAKG